MLATTSHAAVEVHLEGGRVLTALSVERVGDSVILHLESGQMRLPASRVRSVVEKADASAGRLNVEASVTPSPSAPSRGATGPAGSLLDAAARACDRLPAISPLVRGGDLASAESLARQALVTAPGDPTWSIALGEILLMRLRLSEALSQLRSVPARELSPGLTRARSLALAEVLLRLHRPQEAAAALESVPDDAHGSVARARAEATADAALASRGRAGSPHFDVVVPPGTDTLDLGPLLSSLESIFEELRAALGGAPSDRITVLLYPGTEFWEATGMGRDVAALYDGKVRVPVRRLSPASPALTAALRHEVAHAFVDALSAGRADTRWHEGIAEHFEGSDVAPAERALREALRTKGRPWPPPVTHASSHARFEWFLRRYGIGAARQVLAGLATQGTIDAAVRAVTGHDEAGLDAAWRQDLMQERR